MHEQLETVFTLDEAPRRGASAAAQPRISGPFEALARGANSLGDPFECGAEIEEMSAADFCVRLGQPVGAGGRLFVVVRLCRARVALRGAVTRAEALAAGVWRLSVSITHNRFLS